MSGEDEVYRVLDPSPPREQYVNRRSKTVKVDQKGAKFPYNPIHHYACRSLLTENNGKNNAIAMGLCAVFVVSSW